jgi:hypothetical protein
MSIKLMAALWDHHELKPGTVVPHGDEWKVMDKKLRLMKFVLLSLADNANDEGMCWPKVQTTANRCNLSQRYTRGLIGTLERAGWLTRKPTFIKRDDGTYEQTSNMITLNTLRILDQGGEDRASRGGVPAWAGGGGSGEPTKEPSLEPSLEPFLSPDGDAPQPASDEDEEDRRAMFAKVQDITGLKAKMMRSRVGKCVKELRADGYGLSDLNRFGKEVWSKDWRWLKNQQRPTLQQLVEEMGKLDAVPLDIPVQEAPKYGADSIRPAIESARELLDEQRRQRDAQEAKQLEQRGRGRGSDTVVEIMGSVSKSLDSR